MLPPMVATLLLGLVSALGAAATPGVPFPPAVAGGGWQWVSMPGSRCMDGQETGVYIRRGHSESKKLAVYLNGGGACFNTVTCMATSKDPRPGKPGSSGIFSTDERNPLHDFNWINVPYCTGDVHLGAAEKHLGGAHRYFHGHANLQLIAARAVASWPKLETLFVTGESAGGFGALASYSVFRERWTAATGNADLRAALVDDSGPIMDDSAISVCLQEIWRESWNINASLAAGCPCIGSQGNIVSVWAYWRKLYPNDSFGLISSLQDSVISKFFSFGLDDCLSPVPLPGYSKRLEGGLQHLSATGVPVYMIPGDSHTHTTSDEFFSRAVGNTTLYGWVAQLAGSGPDPGSVIAPADGRGSAGPPVDAVSGIVV